MLLKRESLTESQNAPVAKRSAYLDLAVEAEDYETFSGEEEEDEEGGELDEGDDDGESGRFGGEGEFKLGEAKFTRHDSVRKGIQRKFQRYGCRMTYKQGASDGFMTYSFDCFPPSEPPLPVNWHLNPDLVDYVRTTMVKFYAHNQKKVPNISKTLRKVDLFPDVLLTACGVPVTTIGHQMTLMRSKMVSVEGTPFIECLQNGFRIRTTGAFTENLKRFRLIRRDRMLKLPFGKSDVPSNPRKKQDTSSYLPDDYSSINSSPATVRQHGQSVSSAGKGLLPSPNELFGNLDIHAHNVRGMTLSLNPASSLRGSVAGNESTLSQTSRDPSPLLGQPLKRGNDRSMQSLTNLIAADDYLGGNSSGGGGGAPSSSPVTHLNSPGGSSSPMRKGLAKSNNFSKSTGSLLRITDSMIQSKSNIEDLHVIRGREITSPMPSSLDMMRVSNLVSNPESEEPSNPPLLSLAKNRSASSLLGPIMPQILGGRREGGALPASPLGGPLSSSPFSPVSSSPLGPVAAAHPSLLSVPPSFSAPMRDEHQQQHLRFQQQQQQQEHQPLHALLPSDSLSSVPSSLEHLSPPLHRQANDLVSMAMRIPSPMAALVESSAVTLAKIGGSVESSPKSKRGDSVSLPNSLAEEVSKLDIKRENLRND